MMFNQQQVVADAIERYQSAFVIGALNPYEFAGKLIDAVREEEVDLMGASMDHDCKLDEFYSGNCPHPGHHYELVDHQSQTDSEAFRLAR